MIRHQAVSHEARRHGVCALGHQGWKILIRRFLLEKSRTKVRPVQGVVNHPADIHPPHSSQDRILHDSTLTENGT
jgi:hypothetical protein